MTCLQQLSCSEVWEQCQCKVNTTPRKHPWDVANRGFQKLRNPVGVRMPRDHPGGDSLQWPFCCLFSERSDNAKRALGPGNTHGMTDSLQCLGTLLGLAPDNGFFCCVFRQRSDNAEHTHAKQPSRAGECSHARQPICDGQSEVQQPEPTGVGRLCAVAFPVGQSHCCR